MEYQEFLDVTGCTESRLNEADYEELVQPVIEDRRDLFPTDDAVRCHFDRYGINGFDDDFIEALDRLTEALNEARNDAMDLGVSFKQLLTSAEELSL